jgi:hypothetical protein
MTYIPYISHITYIRYDIKSSFSISFEYNNVINNIPDNYVISLTFREKSKFEIRFEI